MTTRIGIVGGGSMGHLHTRVVHQAESARIAWVSDPDVAALERLAAKYSLPTDTTADLRSVDALIIASPTATHHDWAMRAIEAGIPFLVEKPMTPRIEEGETVVEAALDASVPFTVGFVERFNPAIQTLQSIIDEPRYFNAVRHSPYVPRIKTGVASDLLIHDIDLAIRLLGSVPTSVVASYLRVHPSSLDATEDVAEAHLRFEADPALASLSASRLAQRKIRNLTLGGLDRAAELDLIRQDITIYRHVLNSPISEDGRGYRQETIMEIPELMRGEEPLAAQLHHFLALAAGDVDPVAEAQSVIEPHRVLAAADTSAHDSSRPAAVG